MTTEMISKCDRIQSTLQHKTNKVQSQRCTQKRNNGDLPTEYYQYTGAYLHALSSQLFLGETPSEFCNRRC